MEAGASGRYSIVGFRSWALRSFDKLAEWKVTGGQVLSVNNYNFVVRGSGGPRRKTPKVRKGLALKQGSGRVLPSNALI